ncbi:hypothetical protein [[Limnothrix rosea] IAM M-220]|uniref:hypothetical protein n=1 Tax=[Limnothrix rosea] IAM M-220 TaxID=454133 RepID=UPI00096815E1|nr:hypothetical protein [[Limnothrix rosea] IAM M-220]OKH17511.1 hypothetical protein NIES208_09230 [[Limnothrix rosea] IAM M-220]
MLKKISLAAIVAISASVVTAPPASAFSCPDGSLPDPVKGCDTTPVIPTPPAILAVLGMGMASLRKKNKSNDVDAE